MRELRAKRGGVSDGGDGRRKHERALHDVGRVAHTQTRQLGESLGWDGRRLA